MERNTAIDLIKVIAIIGVVTIHSCIGGYAYPVGSWNWGASLFWGSVTRASVPLFFMCSGALLLDPDRALSLKKLFSKNILRVLTALLFWAAAYKAFGLCMDGALSAPAAFQAFKEVLLFKHENHLYYLHIILLVYVLLPITRVFVQYADRRLLEYALGLWFALGILFPTVKVFWPFSLLSDIPLQWMINMSYASVGYGILGYYIKRFHPSGPAGCAAVGLAGFLLVFGATWLGSVRQGKLYEHFLEGMTCGVAALAVGIFGACAALGERRTFSPKVRAALSCGSKASFCVFLTHAFFLKTFPLIGLTVKLLPCAISIPLLTFLNLACSMCVYWLLSHIPVLKKWII